ncbi:MAG: hypothetical protein LQ340_003064 [Diploschistes diacapsis]|nr:MAG: hypothetical protein LQ340_003064 [Diploschistes diacapsis]
MENQANRPHRKTEEKKQRTSGPNPKAFAVAAPGKLRKQAARAHDVCNQRRKDPEQMG